MATKLVYPATFEQDGDYILVQFPDVPIAITQGDSIEQAYEMAEEVLGLSLEDEKKAPKASTVKEIQEQFPNKQVALIGVDMAAHRRKYHSKGAKTNVTIPEWLKEMAQKENINFSQTLTEALKEKLDV
ncbi:type II toxin-antitoxin system HicB family antitoxin [Enterococcus sp. LJL128]|uniref:type II toxin-antitoxin system HicB family antitoxin n=1 Tax=Enterococcus sp. LJL51 TaxID=3416656 RepID=UPI003CE78D88